VRDDDIPTMLANGVCDLGIVGENVLLEKSLSEGITTIKTLQNLNKSACRLSIAVPYDGSIQSVKDLNGKRIATTYPALLKHYLKENKLDAQCIVINGSVEVAPALGMSDAICDLVSSGRTLEENNLTELTPILESQAVLVQNTTVAPEQQVLVDLIVRRIRAIIQADESKYVLFHAPRAKLDQITALLPGCESPSVMPLQGDKDQCAVHAVTKENVFWDTLEKMQKLGAHAILILPIEKMMLEAAA
jgi:ATP phosphoribosyltransferase